MGFATANILREWLRLQQEFHVERAGHGIGTVGSDLAESDLAVHGDGIFHDRVDGIEPHAPVADLAGFGDDPVGEDAAKPFPSKVRAQVRRFISQVPSSSLWSATHPAS